MVLVNKEEAAGILDISRASLKNWIRHGYIRPVGDNRYSEEELRALKKDIESGKLDRLTKRANKTGSRLNFIPSEYIECKEDRARLSEAIQFILDNLIHREQALFLLSVNLLIKSGDIVPSGRFLAFQDAGDFTRESVFKEMNSWFSTISKKPVDRENTYCKYLLEFPLPEGQDILGIVYQSLLHEGKKSKLGSYYTPYNFVKSMVEHNIRPEDSVLDPCCGTGQFLLTFAETIDSPEQIWGADIDPVAVRIARINLFLRFKEDFTPKVYHCNALLDCDAWENSFDFIATNPPWGAKFSSGEKKLLKRRYAQTGSTESFSFFLLFAYRTLKTGGRLSMVLPESCLTVRNHSEIRSYFLDNTRITRIQTAGKLFKKVFSSVIRLDAHKNQPLLDHKVEIQTLNKSYSVKQSRYYENKWNVIDVYCDEKDDELLKTLHSFPCTSLENKSRWALGIVTGDNGKYLKKSHDEGREPVYKGSHISPMKLEESEEFINFEPDKFQQCAPEDLFRAPEKLIYKFISSKLVFAYDDRGCLTLNSANILIPEIEEYSVKAIAALLNSSFYQFYFKKKVNSIKVLRGDIENLPIPLLGEEAGEKLSKTADAVIRGEADFTAIDDLVFSLLNISHENCEYILNELKKT